MVLLKDLFEEAMKNVEYNNQSNKTGFKYVSRVTDDKYKKGFFWRYYLRENGGEISVRGTSLHILKNRVINKGLPWIITDEVLADNNLKSEDI